ncbi:hypothetical protein [Clostridium ihumii]|uniref:hypothetical protein n=1 Tax=Clostridium ihumii TaxID=1470356 RepID=UPI003D353F24
MSKEKVDNLVICSTLNQITNYLIFQRYNPKRAFNITYEKNIRSTMNMAMKNEKWDEYLAKEIMEKNEFDYNVELTSNCSIQKIKEKLKEGILNEIDKDENIYWHITGGQRIITLAISHLLIEEKRENDKIIYIEGNSENLIVNNINGQVDKCDLSYAKDNLRLDQLLRLTGFNTKKLKSTTILKAEGTNQISEENTEYKFYKKLYEILITKRNEKIFIDEENNDIFRNLLLKSNSNKGFEKKEKKQGFLKLVFEKILNNNKELEDLHYDIFKSSEFNNNYPAGYIFEKIVAYRIYDLIKNNCKIVGMETSFKIYLKKIDDNKNQIVDELDIILLTNTGKIINFECKSGGMKGDNAKSHKYTTYRLSGVFGMPILLSPLYFDEFNSDDEIIEKSLQALGAAKSAELEVFALDRIKEGLKRITIIED